MSIETSKDEASGDSPASQTTTASQTVTDGTQECETAIAEPEAGAVATPQASPVRRRVAASRTRKAAVKPTAGTARGAAGKQPAPAKKSAAKKSAAKPVAGGARKNSKARSARKSSTAGGTSKMLKNIAARLDLSRRQLVAALDDLASLVSRQIGSATAPLPRLVKGEWKTVEAFGKQVAGKLGISGKEQPRGRKRPAAAKKSTPKAKKTASKASVSISVKKRPGRPRSAT